MDDLFAARSQMAMSLAFHIVFASIGVAMPVLMLIAEALGAWTGDERWLKLARTWAKGTAVMFAIGAVSGTVLSFELGLLWPKFMAQVGDVIGLPFSLEGFAFFTEAICLGIYIYGWDKVSRPLHLFAGSVVAASGAASAFFVICANGWMNTPSGFRVDESGDFVDIDPFAAMFNTAAIPEAIHMIIGAYLAVGFAVAGIHAWALLRDPHHDLHRRALTVALAVAIPAAFAQMGTGHIVAQMVSEAQPAKLAAMEAHWDTEAWAPFRIGGIPNEEKEETTWAIEIPGMMSMLAYDDPRAVVKGLKEWPRDERPPVWPVHAAFQIMIGCGLALAATGVIGTALAVKKRGLPDDPRYLRLLVAVMPLGIIGIEAGWTVTEVGRQPWIVHGLIRTADAVTEAPGLAAHFLVFTALYAVLTVVVVQLFRHLVHETQEHS